MNKSAAGKPASGVGLSLAFAALFALAVGDLRAGDAFSSSLVPSPDTRVARAIRPWIESGELPGAVSILCDGGRTEVTCAGWADVAAKRPISLDDIFMQCSQTKGFCGVTAAILVERTSRGRCRARRRTAATCLLSAPPRESILHFSSNRGRAGKFNPGRERGPEFLKNLRGHCLNYPADYACPDWAKGEVQKEKAFLEKRFRELAER